MHDRMRKLGVVTSHFEREGVKWTKEILEEAVAGSRNMYEVLHHLGLDAVGGHHAHISRKVKAFGIDTSHFTGPTRTERTRNNGRRRAPEEILRDDRSPQAARTPNSRLRRALLEVGTKECCAFCGIEAVWQGDPPPLEVDHIDGDWRNNRRENLRFLCPNCHSTTDTYRGRGKGRR
ncbi:HNH endonuclease signature motif containing protein [Streptomyces sp. NPDC002054]|uniref:HNH endonuclease signature motif containing protein n=1 Tax=Streptomyces sp. NPDC002054 TaxID=3154663 RepID=UPI003331AB16